MPPKINVIDLFAGPGGLGEGFSAFNNSFGTYPFSIKMSVEKESSAHKTLQLRAFYRQFPKGEAPEEYYKYIRDPESCPKEALFKKYKKQTERAIEETLALPRELGNPDDDEFVFNRLRTLKRNHKDEMFVVIGGPPCQAYSLAGRSRNAGIKGYSPESDHRVVLYKEYLKVLDVINPEVFVMENVRGILSAKLNGKRIFPDILQDLRNPGKACGRKTDHQYKIYSFVRKPDFDDPVVGPCYDEDSSFTIKSEEFGIPQRRHRVILLGVRHDLGAIPDTLKKASKPVSLKTIIDGFPVLRSGLSKGHDNSHNWSNELEKSAAYICDRLSEEKEKSLASTIKKHISSFKNPSNRGDRYVKSRSSGFSSGYRGELKCWIHDPRLKGFPNHETRGHIVADLERYLWAAGYAELHSKNKNPSPKAKDFPSFLAPNHQNWESGDHADRFRVQVKDKPATTITSHISKDGHYYIHYDPSQCRSLTVREAARVQTFPDNYFFEGNRSQQYVQVGNAVPPFLAKQIASIVYKLLAETNLVQK